MAFYVYIIMQPKAIILERKHWIIKNKDDIACILYVTRALIGAWKCNFIPF